MNRVQWPRVKLADHVDLISGFPFKSAGFTAAPVDIPLVKGENVHQGSIDWNKAKRWPRNQIAGMEKYWLKPGDVILAMDRPWIEAGLKQACIRRHDPPSLLVQRVSRLRGINGLLTAYLRHLIGSPSFTDYIKPIVTGINVPHISGAQIKGFEFRLPPRPAQERIASILSAYDDLIENNTRRIAILEEMARRIYEEWFVRFRFPGHEGVRMVESELGLMPDGWAVTTLGRLAEVNARSVRRGAEPTEIRYVDISSVSTGSIDNKEPMLFADAPGRARRIVQDGDVIWACVRPNRKSYSLVLDPEPNLLVSTGFAVLSPVAAPWSFVYQCVTTDDFVSHLVNHATGVAYPAVGAEDFENAKVLKPTDGLATAFDRIAEPMMRLVAALQRKNANLRTTRDLLLPKLISGELDVSAMPEPEALAA